MWIVLLRLPRHGDSVGQSNYSMTCIHISCLVGLNPSRRWMTMRKHLWGSQGFSYLNRFQQSGWKNGTISSWEIHPNFMPLSHSFSVTVVRHTSAGLPGKKRKKQAVKCCFPTNNSVFILTRNAAWPLTSPVLSSETSVMFWLNPFHRPKYIFPVFSRLLNQRWVFHHGTTIKTAKNTTRARPVCFFFSLLQTDRKTKSAAGVG